jgi:hypothetical protein
MCCPSSAISCQAKPDKRKHASCDSTIFVRGIILNLVVDIASHGHTMSLRVILFFKPQYFWISENKD